MADERRVSALAAAVEEARAAWPGISVSEELLAAIVLHQPASEKLDEWLSLIRMPDLVLATACSIGDAAALQIVDRDFFSGIGSAIRRIDPAVSFLDEVRQELRVHLLVARDDQPPRIRQYAGLGSLTSWIHVAAARMAITLKRRAGQGPSIVALPSDLEGTGGPDQSYVRERYREDLQAAFAEALADLSPRQRNILRMHFLDGAPLDRMAAVYGTHRTTLGRWVTQACEQIFSRTRERLGERLEIPPQALDSLIALLRSQMDLSVSLLMSGTAIEG